MCTGTIETTTRLTVLTEISAPERARSSANMGTFSVSIQNAATQSATWWRAFRGIAHTHPTAATGATTRTLASKTHERVNASTGASNRPETQRTLLVSAQHMNARVENRRHNVMTLMACALSVMPLGDGIG
jgi:hypothetical protein